MFRWQILCLLMLITNPEMCTLSGQATQPFLFYFFKGIKSEEKQRIAALGVFGRIHPHFEIINIYF